MRTPLYLLLSFFICRLPFRLVYHVFFLNALHYRSQLGTLRCSFLLQIDSPTLRVPILPPPFVSDCLYNRHFRHPRWRARCFCNFAPAPFPLCTVIAAFIRCCSVLQSIASVYVWPYCNAFIPLTRLFEGLCIEWEREQMIMMKGALRHSQAAHYMRVAKVKA